MWSTKPNSDKEVTKYNVKLSKEEETTLLIKFNKLSEGERPSDDKYAEEWNNLTLVWPECVRQRNEVAIKLGIISSLSLWADLVSNWPMTSKASLLIGCWELTHIGPS